jgi:hypothetical protein
MIALTLALAARANPCLRFERNEQVAVVPYQRAMDVEEVTIEARIKVDPSSTDQFFNYILCRNYGDFGYGMAIHGRPVKVFSQAPATRVPIDTWTHVALVCSRRSGKLYVDGEVAGAWEEQGARRPFAHPIMIGNSDMQGQPGNTPTPFRGCIDEVRIWSIPRTQAAIRRTMKRYLRGNEPGLLAYFPFNEGQGQILHDYTGHLISGSLGGGFTPDGDDPLWDQAPDLQGSRPKLRPKSIR